MQAAVGHAQMDRLEDFIAARKANFQRLKDGLKAHEDIFILPEATPKSDPSWFGFPITTRDGAPFTRDDLIKYLNDKKIGTRLLFGGNLIRQPYMNGRNFRVHGSLDASDKVVRDTFWLGVYPGLGEDAINYILDEITRFRAGKA